MPEATIKKYLAREAFKTRQTNNFGDFDALISRTPELVLDIEAQLAKLDTLLAYGEVHGRRFASGPGALKTDDLTRHRAYKMVLSKAAYN